MSRLVVMRVQSASGGAVSTVDTPRSRAKVLGRPMLPGRLKAAETASRILSEAIRETSSLRRAAAILGVRHSHIERLADENERASLTVRDLVALALGGERALVRHVLRRITEILDEIDPPSPSGAGGWAPTVGGAANDNDDPVDDAPRELRRAA